MSQEAASPVLVKREDIGGVLPIQALLISRFLPQHLSGGSLEKCDEPPSSSSSASSSGAPRAAPNKQLLTTVTLLGVLYANCIGSGYGFEDSVGAAGPLVTLIFCLVIPWVWCLPTGLAVSELSTAVKSNSGVLMWINVAFHPAVSFMCVLITVFITFVGNASYPSLAADYVAKLFPIGEVGQVVVKALCLGICAVLNISGVEIVGNASVVLSLVTIAPFLIFTTKQLLFSTDGLNVTALLHVKEHVDWPTFFAITSWSFANIENAGSVVEEVRNPKKTMAAVMVPLILLTYPAYFFPVAAGVSALGANQDWSKWQSGYWSHVADVICGPSVKWMLFAGSIVTTFGFTVTTLCCTSRSLEGMGTMEIFPNIVNRWLTHTHATYHTPVNAILLNATVTALFSLALSFDSIVALCQILYCVRLIMIYVSVVKLRLDHPNLVRPYQLPCGTLGCVLALAPAATFSLVVAVSCAYHDPFVKNSVGIFAIGGSALSYYYVSYHRPRGFRGQVVSVLKGGNRGGESMASSADDDGGEALGLLSSQSPTGNITFESSQGVTNAATGGTESMSANVVMMGKEEVQPEELRLRKMLK